MTNKIILLAVFLALLLVACLFRYDYGGIYGSRVDRWTGKLEVVCIVKEGSPWMTIKECAE